MPVYRCSQCNLVAEDIHAVSGSKSTCRKCQAPVTLFATPFYIEKLLDRYQALLRELDALKQQEDELKEPAADNSNAAALMPALLKEQMHSTLLLATESQHAPLGKWFTDRQVKASFDYALVDTTGFFDEAARTIGDQYEALIGALDQVRHAYRRDWSRINIELANIPGQQQQQLKSVLRQLYSHTFFSRYIFQKDKHVIGLVLQPAQAIRRFFEGGWLEWWAFMTLLEILLERNLGFSCARSVKVEFHNQEQRELDVVFLVQNRIPIVIECKSGEFRTELEKYTKLQKRLGLDRNQFIICSPDLDNEQAAGLTAMYGLTFVNLTSFPAHIASLLGTAP